MKTRSALIGLSLAAATVIAAAGLSTAVATSALRLGPPAPVVATVNLEELVKQLDERAAREAELRSYSEGLQGQLDSLVKELNDAQAKIAALDGNERKNQAARVLELQAMARAKKEIFEAMVDARRAEVFRGLYDKINDASKRLAEKNKYTMVISADDSARIPPSAGSQDVERQISLRRFIFVDKAHDVTSELVAMMNNEFKAGGSSAAPMPATR
jgi:Skp family chaperone for outer membrane proteins